MPKGSLGLPQAGDIRMRVSKPIASKKQIEKEIYKTFEQVKENKTVSIAEFLKSFDASLFECKKYRKIKFSYESFIKLILYQKLKGIKFQTKLTKHLRRNLKDKFRLGFNETPDRRTIGFFQHHILNKETKELLDFTADKIEEVSEKFNILLDIKIYEPEKPIKETKERNQYLQKKEKTREICRIVKKRFSPFIDGEGLFICFPSKTVDL